MAPTSFKDLSKKADDLLTSKDYCFDRKLKLTSKTSDGVALTMEGAMGGKGVNGKLTSKFAPYSGIAVDKLCVDTTGRFTLESSLTDLFDGLKVTVKAADGSSKGPAGSLHAVYKTSSLNSEVSATVVGAPVVSAVASFGYDSFTLGGSADYDTGSSDLKDFAAGLSYSSSDFVASVTGKKKLGAFGLGLHHQVSSDVAVGAVVDFEGGFKGATIGASKKLSGDASVMGKVDSAGVVSANWIQVLSPGVKLVTSAQVNAKDFAGDSHKFGLTLNLSA